MVRLEDEASLLQLCEDDDAEIFKIFDDLRHPKLLPSTVVRNAAHRRAFCQIKTKVRQEETAAKEKGISYTMVQNSLIFRHESFTFPRAPYRISE